VGGLLCAAAQWSVASPPRATSVGQPVLPMSYGFAGPFPLPRWFLSTVLWTNGRARPPRLDVSPAGGRVLPYSPSAQHPLN
jgi:hypothetical protein